MTHGHGQQCGDGLWEQGGGLDRGGKRGKSGNNYNRINKQTNKRIKPEKEVEYEDARKEDMASQKSYLPPLRVCGSR